MTSLTIRNDEVMDYIGKLYLACPEVKLDEHFRLAVEHIAHYQKVEKQMLVLYDIVTDMPVCFEDFLNEEQRILFDIDEAEQNDSER